MLEIYFECFVQLAQPIIPLCPTVIWSQTFVNLAGALSTSGSSANLLSSPTTVDFDAYRNMYVVDQSNHRIQRFSPGNDELRNSVESVERINF